MKNIRNAQSTVFQLVSLRCKKVRWIRDGPDLIIAFLLPRLLWYVLLRSGRNMFICARVINKYLHVLKITVEQCFSVNQSIYINALTNEEVFAVFSQ